VSDVARGKGTQAEMRAALLGEVSCHGEKPDDELQRAYEHAHRIVGERGRGMEDLSLLLARAVVRLSSHLVELTEREREAKIAGDEQRVRQATEVAELTLQLAGSRERTRAMMRQLADVRQLNERAVELMLAMLEGKSQRISDHPEWVLELGQLSGAES